MQLMTQNKNVHFVHFGMQSIKNKNKQWRVARKKERSFHSAIRKYCNKQDRFKDKIFYAVNVMFLLYVHPFNTKQVIYLWYYKHVFVPMTSLQTGD